VEKTRIAALITERQPYTKFGAKYSELVAQWLMAQCQPIQQRKIALESYKRGLEKFRSSLPVGQLYRDDIATGYLERVAFCSERRPRDLNCGDQIRS